MFTKQKMKIVRRMYDAIKGNPVTSDSVNLNCENGMLMLDICEKMNDLCKTVRFYEDRNVLNAKLLEVRKILNSVVE